MLLHAPGSDWLGTNPATGVAIANAAIAEAAMTRVVIDVDCILSYLCFVDKRDMWKNRIRKVMQGCGLVKLYSWLIVVSVDF